LNIYANALQKYAKNKYNKLFFQKLISIFVAEMKNTKELKLEKHRVEITTIHSKESLFEK